MPSRQTEHRDGFAGLESSGVLWRRNHPQSAPVIAAGHATKRYKKRVASVRDVNKVAEKLGGSYYYKIGDSWNEVTFLLGSLASNLY